MSAIKPLNPKFELLKDLPDKFMVGNSVDWKAVQSALELDDMNKLKDALLWLYMSNTKVNYYVNETLLQLAVLGLSGDFKFPPPPPTDQELPWLTADLGCESCPGSEYTEVTPGVTFPLCGSQNRVERYTECAKYRENLTNAVIPPEQVTQHYHKLKDDFKEIFNDSLSPQATADGPRPVDTNGSTGGNPAADVVSRHFG